MKYVPYRNTIKRNEDTGLDAIHLSIGNSITITGISTAQNTISIISGRRLLFIYNKLICYYYKYSNYMQIKRIRNVPFTDKSMQFTYR